MRKTLTILAFVAGLPTAVIAALTPDQIAALSPSVIAGLSTSQIDVLGTDQIVSMSVPTDGSYDVPEGIISSFPCRVKNGKYEIVQGLELNDFSKERILASAKRLQDERAAVEKLGLI